MYKYLLFDLDNTLFDFDLAEDIALTKLLEEQGVDDIKKYKEYYLPMNKELWHKLDKKEITREYLVKNRFKILFNHFGLEVDGDYLANRYKELLGLQGQHFDGAVEFLENLKKNNMKIFGATNGLITIQESRLKNSAISKYFDDIFISERIGVQKPDIEFFNYLSNKIPGFEKNKAVMIGDNLFADIGGGNNFGIDTIWVNLKGVKNNSDVLPTYEIKNYNELEKILLKSNN